VKEPENPTLKTVSGLVVELLLEWGADTVRAHFNIDSSADFY
jgi:hypothetical protein